MKERLRGSDEYCSSRPGLDQVCLLLTTPSPEALDRAAAILDAVVAEIADARRGMQRERAAPLAEYQAIRRASRMARILLDKAAAFHAGWNARLRSLTAGYEPGGEAAASTWRGRLSVEG
jgi:hypothetical protein